MNEILEEFSSLIRKVDFRQNDISADSIRVHFISAILKRTNIKRDEIFTEYPRPKIEDKERDLYIPSTSSKSGLAVQFEYHRRPPCRHSGETQKAGNLFKCIYKLTQFDKDPDTNLWLIYVTDDEMAEYLKK
jgi:hypothetical protein